VSEASRDAYSHRLSTAASAYCGYAIDAKKDIPWKFNDVLARSGAISARLAELDATQASQLLDRSLDDSTADSDEITGAASSTPEPSVRRNLSESWEQPEAKRLLREQR
jgi:hypothetical protein